jgi:DNA repair protein RadD
MTDKFAFQERALKQIVAGLRERHKMLCVSPTGSGKGTMAMRLIKAALKTDKQAVFVCPRIEIADDIRDRLVQNGIKAGILAGSKKPSDAPVQVCTIQSILNSTPPKASMLILDEAHHYVAEQWSTVVDMYPKAAVVGFTAFPERADGTKLNDIFDDLVVAAQYSELIESGAIVPCELWRPSNILGADLAMSALQAYREHGVGQTIVYERSHAHVEKTAQEFRDAGIPAVGIVDSTPRDIRRQAIADFKAGKLPVLVNYLILTEGTNLPTAQTAILCRGFGYISTYIQCVGRVLRSNPDIGKTKGVVLDLSGASHRYDFPDSDRDYSLRANNTVSNGRKFSASVGLILGMPLGKAIRPEPKARQAEREQHWAKLMAAVKTRQLSLLDARNNFRQRFDQDAPLW